MRWSDGALGQLVLSRLREFYREPEAVFWVYGFPILMTVALGIAFRDNPEPQYRVDVTGPGAAAVIGSAMASLRDRQHHGRPASGLRTDPDRSAVPFAEEPGEKQPEPHPLPRLLSREEGFSDASQRFGVDPCPGVADRHRHFALGGGDLTRDSLRSAAGVDRVLDDVAARRDEAVEARPLALDLQLELALGRRPHAVLHLAPRVDVDAVDGDDPVARAQLARRRRRVVEHRADDRRRDHRVPEVEREVEQQRQQQVEQRPGAEDEVARPQRAVAQRPVGLVRGQLLVGRLPEAPAQFGEDEYTDRSERFLVAEFVREQLMRQLGEELPYATAVEIERYADEPGITRIAAVIWVERDGQKSIVIGAGGAQLKKIGSAARRAMEQMLGRRVFLELWVRVRESWSDDAAALRQFGYSE